MKNKPKVSAVIATMGTRLDELSKVLYSLSKQDLPPHEIIIVDQSDQNHISNLISSLDYNMDVIQIKTMDLDTEGCGVSWARNIGLKYINGDYVFFPDDDCWYPRNFISSCLQSIREHNVSFVTGRSVDESTNKSINALYLPYSSKINNYNVWFTSIEWTIFFKKEVFEKSGVFDENLGVGTKTKWGSTEGQDILIRAMKEGFKGYFDYNINGYHQIVKHNSENKKAIEKIKSYGRGTGRVLSIHNYRFLALFIAILPIVKIPISFLKMNFGDIKTRFFILFAIFEGYYSK